MNERMDFDVCHADLNAFCYVKNPSNKYKRTAVRIDNHLDWLFQFKKNRSLFHSINRIHDWLMI